MSQIEQIMHNRRIWSEIPNQLCQTIDQIYRNVSWYYSSQSRTLQQHLQYSIGGYGSGYTTSYKTLAGMCSLLMQNKVIKVIPGYHLVRSEEGETLTINQVIEWFLTNLDRNTHHIHIMHIPKGKTYLRKTLDKTKTLTRLSQIETFCIEHPNHFIRIYKGFGNTNPDDITIFTDFVSQKLIQTLWVMLPNLFEINEYDTTGSDIIPEEYAKHNTKVKALREVFEILYDYYRKTPTDSLSENEITEAKTKLTTALIKFTNTFNFEEEHLNTFTAKLAKARNDIILDHYVSDLNRAESKIESLERQLEEQYAIKSNTERQILSIKMVNEDDVAVFMDTIKSTKAIEILGITDSSLRLRITAPLQYFTQSDFERYESNSTSEYTTRYRSNPYHKQILHKIFTTREYKLLAQGIINININNIVYSDLPLSLNAQTMNIKDFTQFPNPHLWHHNCWQAARNEINKNICAGNFELVIMQMVAAVQTINVAEHASFVNGLLVDFLNHSITNTCCTIIDKNNKSYTLAELIEHEKELEAQQKTEEYEKEVQAAKEILETNRTEGYSQIELPDDGEDWETPNNTTTEVLPF